MWPSYCHLSNTQNLSVLALREDTELKVGLGYIIRTCLKNKTKTEINLSPQSTEKEISTGKRDGHKSLLITSGKPFLIYALPLFVK